MNRADAALFESIAIGMRRRPLPEAVRRRGDKFAPGKNLPGLSTFTAKSKGGKEEDGTTFKAKTADDKVVPIIMRGEAGKGGTAEVIIPGGKRVSLSIQQASKLRQNISLYDLKDVPKLVAAIRAGKPLPEHEGLKHAGLESLTEAGLPSEAQMLAYLKKQGGKSFVMPNTVAYAFDVSIGDAKKFLDSLASKGVLKKSTAGRLKRPKYSLAEAAVDPIRDIALIEKAPPGWAGTVKAMKKHMPVEKAFALAWTGYKQGKEPHYKDDGQSTTSKGEPKKKKKKFQSEEAVPAKRLSRQPMKGSVVTIDGDNRTKWRVVKSSPKTATIAMITDVDLGARFAGKTYVFKWDGEGFKRRGEYLTVLGKAESVELEEAAEAASVEIETAFQLWLKKLRQSARLRGARDVGYHKGPKYWKVFSQMEPGNRSALHFFDPSNGDIYKAESWKKKAPRVRANVLKLNLSMGEGAELPEEADMEEARGPKIPEGKSLVFKRLDMGNNESKSIAISRDGDGTLTAMTYTRSKGGFKSVSGAQKWLEKQLGKKLSGGIVESMDKPDQDDTEFLAAPGDIQKSIEAKLGLSGMQGPQAVLKTISQMYSANEVPAAVYAAASGMARAEQRLSVPLAKAMNQLDAATVAAAITKGVSGTSAPTIKNMERWWMSEIAKLSGTDRDGQNSPVLGVLPAEVQPYIDSMAVEAIDFVFEQAMGDSGCELPIGSGALSGPEAIGTAAGYEEPMEVPGADLSSESPISPGEAAAAIQNGVPRSNETDRARSHETRMPGEGRIKPGQYTAEEFDALPFKDRIRMAEAYDRLMGDAPDMGQEEVVNAESYKAMLRNRHSNPNGSTTPVAKPEGSNGAVVVDDVDDVDDAFAAVAEDEDN